MPIAVVKDIADIVSNLATVLALLLGGVWTFYHFVNGRVFKPCMTVSVDACPLHTRSGDYVVCTVRVSNVGLSMIDIADADVRIACLGSDLQRVRLGGAKMLRAHQRIEPGTILNEQIAIPCPANDAPILVDARVVVRPKHRAAGSAFTANAVVGMSVQGNSQPQTSVSTP